MVETKKIGNVLIVLALILLLVFVSVKLTLDKQGEFLCQVVSEDPTIEMKDCPAHNNSSSWLLLIAFLASFIIGIAGVYLLLESNSPLRKKVEGIKAETNKDLSCLDGGEKKVYKLLQKKEGSLYQSEIAKELEISKVKVTRILDSLEHKHNLVERKRRGMTNIVVLKK